MTCFRGTDIDISDWIRVGVATLSLGVAATTAHAAGGDCNDALGRAAGTTCVDSTPSRLDVDAGSTAASPLGGTWKKEFSCNGLSGPYAARCNGGERDKFQLSIVVDGDRVCALHIVWANLGQRVDEVEDRTPSMTGKADGTTAIVRYRSAWGGTGTATLRAQGNTLHWKVNGKAKGESWIPDEAVLERIQAMPHDRMPQCPR